MFYIVARVNASHCGDPSVAVPLDYAICEPRVVAIGPNFLAAWLVGLSRSKGESRENRDTFTNADASELQDVLAYADVYMYLEDHPGRYYLLARRDPLRIRMYKETQHMRPHIHIDYGKERHIASYALDTGGRLAGNLDPRYDKAISAWIAQSQERLFRIWAAIQSGIDPEILIAELQGDDW